MEPTKTVLYVITKATWGGAQRYVYDLIETAKNRGYTPFLAYGEHGLLAERVEALGVPTYHVPSLIRDISPLKELAAKRELRTLIETLKPDVVHLNSSKAGYTGARAAREARVPRIIFTAHGWAFTEPRSWIVRRIFSYLHKQTVLLTDVTIAVSEFIAAPTRVWNLPKGRVVVIHHGIGALPFLSKEEARAALIKQDPSLAKNKRWVGTIAELHLNKGIDIGISAWKKANVDAEWTVIGGGEEKEVLAAQAKDTPSIHLLGFLPDAWKYLKAFDLFILPSRTEALGYVVLEAGAAGVPVIASDYGGAREIVERDALFKAEDADSLAERIAAFLSNKESLNSKGEALQKRIRESFSLERMLNETFAQY